MRNPKWLVDKMAGMVSISYLPPSQENMLNEFKMRFQTPYGVIEMQRQSGPIMCEMATLDDVYLSHMNLPQEEDTILSGKHEREHINEFVQKHRVLFQRTLERSGHMLSLADSRWDLMRVCFITEFGQLDLRRFLFNGQFPPEPLYSAVLNGVDVSYLNMFQEGDIYSRQMEAELANDILETILDTENINKFVEKHKMLFQRAMVQAIHET